MTATIINVAYCQEHFKGGDRINCQNGQQHAEWLEMTVDHLHRRHGRKVFVSITGFQGWPYIEISPGHLERDVLWRVFGKTRFITMAGNPGHQVGAAWCIRLGLEAAGKLGYAFMIHTAEDVLPHGDAIRDIESRLLEGADYVGERWGPDGDQWNSQFFGCRVSTLAATFDPPAVTGAGCLEKYLAQQLRGKNCSPVGRLYEHTHDFEEMRRWIKERS